MDARLAYRALLRLYPHDYRARFEAEMVRAFERESGECRGIVLHRFLLRELFGLAAGAAAEWAAKLTTDPSVRGRSLPDVRMMRPAGVPREVWFAGDRKSVEERIASLIDRTVHAIAHHDFEGARRYCREEDELRRLQEADFR